MDKLNKLSLPATIIITSLILGGFFYASQVNKQRSIERQQQIKIEQEKQDQLAKEVKEQQVKEEAEQALNTCLANAVEIYSDQWHRECKALGKLTDKCIDIKELSFDEYLKKYNLTTEEYARERNLTPSNPDDSIELSLLAGSDYTNKASDECSCRLLISKADKLNERLERNKAECFKRYPPK